MLAFAGSLEMELAYLRLFFNATFVVGCSKPESNAKSIDLVDVHRQLLQLRTQLLESFTEQMGRLLERRAWHGPLRSCELSPVRTLSGGFTASAPTAEA